MSQTSPSRRDQSESLIPDVVMSDVIPTNTCIPLPIDESSVTTQVTLQQPDVMSPSIAPINPQTASSPLPKQQQTTQQPALPLNYEQMYKAAGLIPFIFGDKDVYFLLGVERRRSHQPCLQLCAGKRETTDKSSFHTALREFEEETGYVIQRSIGREHAFVPLVSQQHAIDEHIDDIHEYNTQKQQQQHQQQHKSKNKKPTKKQKKAAAAAAAAITAAEACHTEAQQATDADIPIDSNEPPAQKKLTKKQKKAAAAAAVAAMAAAVTEAETGPIETQRDESQNMDMATDITRDPDELVQLDLSPPNTLPPQIDSLPQTDTLPPPDDTLPKIDADNTLPQIDAPQTNKNIDKSALSFAIYTPASKMISHFVCCGYTWQPSSHIILKSRPTSSHTAQANHLWLWANRLLSPRPISIYSRLTTSVHALFMYQTLATTFYLKQIIPQQDAFLAHAIELYGDVVITKPPPPPPEKPILPVTTELPAILDDSVAAAGSIPAAPAQLAQLPASDELNQIPHDPVSSTCPTTGDDLPSAAAPPITDNIPQPSSPLPSTEHLPPPTLSEQLPQSTSLQIDPLVAPDSTTALPETVASAAPPSDPLAATASAPPSDPLSTATADAATADAATATADAADAAPPTDPLAATVSAPPSDPSSAAIPRPPRPKPPKPPIISHPSVSFDDIYHPFNMAYSPHLIFPQFPYTHLAADYISAPLYDSPSNESAQHSCESMTSDLSQAQTDILPSSLSLPQEQRSATQSAVRSLLLWSLPIAHHKIRYHPSLVSTIDAENSYPQPAALPSDESDLTMTDETAEAAVAAAASVAETITDQVSDLVTTAPTTDQTTTANTTPPPDHTTPFFIPDHHNHFLSHPILKPNSKFSSFTKQPVAAAVAAPAAAAEKCPVEMVEIVPASIVIEATNPTTHEPSVNNNSDQPHVTHDQPAPVVEHVTEPAVQTLVVEPVVQALAVEPAVEALVVESAVQTLAVEPVAQALVVEPAVQTLAVEPAVTEPSSTDTTITVSATPQKQQHISKVKPEKKTKYDPDFLPSDLRVYWDDLQADYDKNHLDIASALSVDSTAQHIVPHDNAQVGLEATSDGATVGDTVGNPEPLSPAEIVATLSTTSSLPSVQPWALLPQHLALSTAVSGQSSPSDQAKEIVAAYFDVAHFEHEAAITAAAAAAAASPTLLSEDQVDNHESDSDAVEDDQLDDEDDDDDIGDDDNDDDSDDDEKNDDASTETVASRQHSQTIVVQPDDTDLHQEIATVDLNSIDTTAQLPDVTTTENPPIEDELINVPPVIPSRPLISTDPSSEELQSLHIDLENVSHFPLLTSAQRERLFDANNMFPNTSSHLHVLPDVSMNKQHVAAHSHGVRPTIGTAQSAQTSPLSYEQYLMRSLYTALKTLPHNNLVTNAHDLTASLHIPEAYDSETLQSFFPTPAEQVFSAPGTKNCPTYHALGHDNMFSLHWVSGSQLVQMGLVTPAGPITTAIRDIKPNHSPYVSPAYNAFQRYRSIMQLYGNKLLERRAPVSTTTGFFFPLYSAASVLFTHPAFRALLEVLLHCASRSDPLSFDQPISTTAAASGHDRKIPVKRKYVCKARHPHAKKEGTQQPKKQKKSKAPPPAKKQKKAKASPAPKKKKSKK